MRPFGQVFTSACLLLLAMTIILNAQQTVVLTKENPIHEDVVINAGGSLVGSGAIEGGLTVQGTVAPGTADDIGVIVVGKDLVLQEGANLNIALHNSGEAGNTYSSIKVGGRVQWPETGVVTLTLRGLENHNVEGSDVFRVLQGPMGPVPAERIRLDN